MKASEQEARKALSLLWAQGGAVRAADRGPLLGPLGNEKLEGGVESSKRVLVLKPRPWRRPRTHCPLAW